jgi:hypothetical protein
MKSASIKSLLPQEHTRLDELSNETRDDAMGEAPGSERGDEEERLFLAALSEEDRHFYEDHKGLGNSQKAEVAWLEMMGYAYEELDARLRRRALVTTVHITGGPCRVLEIPSQNLVDVEYSKWRTSAASARF